MSREESVAITVLAVIGGVIIIIASLNQARSMREDKHAELARQLQGIVVKRWFDHDTFLQIRTDTGIVLNTGAGQDLAKVVQVGDSIIKKAYSPYCLLIRDGRKLGYYWYTAVLWETDANGDTIPPPM